MPWNSLKLILFLCILVTLFNFPTTKAQDDADAGFLDEMCSADQTTANSIYEKNLGTLFSSLSSNATSKIFYTDTVLGRNYYGTVYGLFMCRGDLPSKLCTQCVVNATERLSSECPMSTKSVIWYEKCMVRYSDVPFFSTVDTYLSFSMLNMANISSNSARFMSLLSDTMNQTADEAANSTNRYSTKEANVSHSQSLYFMAQCTQDLSPQNCSICLTLAISYLLQLSKGKQGGRVVYSSCNIRYELYPFYGVGVTDQPPRGLVSGYVSHNCSGNQNINNYTTFQSDLRTLLSDLSSNAAASAGNGNTSSIIQAGTVRGLYTCRGDLSPYLCGECVRNATQRIASECGLASEAIIWYYHCWLRYSTTRARPFTMEKNPRYVDLIVGDTNPKKYSDVDKLSTKLDAMVIYTGDTGAKYQTGTFILNGLQTVYILAQCTLDLSSDACGACLQDMVRSAIPWAHLGGTSVAGQVLYPSCILRFELFKFYDLTSTTTTSNITQPLHHHQSHHHDHQGILIDGRPIAVKRLSRNSKQGLETLEG